jgi:hypothetical protein
MAQPNMGERKQYAIRPPKDVATALEKKIARDPRSCSLYLADLVADRYALPRPSGRFRTKTDLGGQATLPLGKGVRPRRRPAPPRDLYKTRLPLDVAAAFEAETAGLGPDFSYSLFLTDLLAEHCGLPLPSRRMRTRSATNDGEVLSLERAS